MKFVVSPHKLLFFFQNLSPSLNLNGPCACCYLQTTSFHSSTLTALNWSVLTKYLKNQKKKKTLMILLYLPTFPNSSSFCIRQASTTSMCCTLSVDIWAGSRTCKEILLRSDVSQADALDAMFTRRRDKGDLIYLQDINKLLTAADQALCMILTSGKGPVKSVDGQPERKDYSVLRCAAESW